MSPWPEGHVFAVDFALDVRAAVADEVADGLEADSAPLVVADVRRDHCLDALGFGEELVLVPVFGHEFLHRRGIFFSDGRNLVQLVGQETLEPDGARGAPVNPEAAVFLEQTIRAPGHEVESVGPGIEVDEVVVAVAGVAVPKTEQALKRPEFVERLLVDQLPDRIPVVVLVDLQLGDHEQVGAFRADVHAVNREEVAALV